MWSPGESKMRRTILAIGVLLLLGALVFGLSVPSAALQFGQLVQIEQLSFHPDTLTIPGNAFAVLVVQNREDAPIVHEVSSKDLFQSGTLVLVQGTGTIEYNDQRVSRVLLDPGEEVVVWFYAVKGRTYSFQCNLNGHSMLGTVRAI
jgi:uncharacterized cupredoxin-like copper-binding protein